MIVEIAKISEEVRTYEGEEPSLILGLETDPFIKEVEPIHYIFHMQAVSGELVVRGRIFVYIMVECSRCGEDFRLRTEENDFTVSKPFQQRSDCIDLTEDIREAILLAFPSFPVCRNDCKGLCSICGKDLNNETCKCLPPSDLRWNALDGLALKKSKGFKKTKGS